jgi:hypothetical protein
MRNLLIEAFVAISISLSGIAWTSEPVLSGQVALQAEGKETPAESTGQDSPGTLSVHEKELETVTKAILERIGSLSIHGGVVGFYQGTNDVKIDGEEFRNPDGAGFVADLELTFSPIEGSEMLLRIHAGEGDGADRELEAEGALFADLNTLNDDNPGDDGLRLLDVFYTHAFLDEKFFFSIGKTEPLAFVDDNAFANDEYAQFVGKPLVNNPVLDSENEYAPLVALRARPAEAFALTLVLQSSSRPLLDEEQQKSSFDNIFDKPFLAGQLAFSPALGDHEGNYRIYGWAQTYDHPKLTGDGSKEGWGIGLSLDQEIHEKVGLFARFGYQNEEVYEVPWFWSAGTQIKGLLPVREEDELGMGVAGLHANKDLQNDGTELHLEAYWRVAFGEHFALSPDIQYVINPLGDHDNDGVVAGMLRGEAYF